MLELMLPDEYRDADWADVFKLVADHVSAAFDAKGDVCVLITDDEGIRRTNAEFRGIDRATDVLSFPAGDGFFGEGESLGDIMISLPRAVEQAKEYRHPLRRELAFLTTHGMLHLLGYDHMTPEDEAEMRLQQTRLLSEMGLER